MDRSMSLKTGPPGKGSRTLVALELVGRVAVARYQVLVQPVSQQALWYQPKNYRELYSLTFKLARKNQIFPRLQNNIVSVLQACKTSGRRTACCPTQFSNYARFAAANVPFFYFLFFFNF
jgi:hypothetical protein